MMCYTRPAAAVWKCTHVDRGWIQTLSDFNRNYSQKLECFTGIGTPYERLS
jgi:hypothetical protein